MDITKFDFKKFTNALAAKKVTDFTAQPFIIDDTETPVIKGGVITLPGDIYKMPNAIGIRILFPEDGENNVYVTGYFAEDELELKGFFGTGKSKEPKYTKSVIRDIENQADVLDAVMFLNDELIKMNEAKIEPTKEGV